MKQRRQLWRLILGHDYEDDEGEIVTNDWRHNFAKLLCQGKLNLWIYSDAKYKGFTDEPSSTSRGWIRHSLFDNDRQYIDLAAGLFYEDENT